MNYNSKEFFIMSENEELTQSDSMMGRKWYHFSVDFYYCFFVFLFFCYLFTCLFFRVFMSVLFICLSYLRSKVPMVNLSIRTKEGMVFLLAWKLTKGEFFSHVNQCSVFIQICVEVRLSISGNTNERTKISRERCFMFQRENRQEFSGLTNRLTFL